MKEIKIGNKKLYKKWIIRNFFCRNGGLLFFLASPFLAVILSIGIELNHFLLIIIGFAILIVMTFCLFFSLNEESNNFEKFLYREKTKKIYKDNYKYLM